MTAGVPLNGKAAGHGRPTGNGLNLGSSGADVTDRDRMNAVPAAGMMTAGPRGATSANAGLMTAAGRSREPRTVMAPTIADPGKKGTAVGHSGKDHPGGMRVSPASMREPAAAGPPREVHTNVFPLSAEGPGSR